MNAGRPADPPGDEGYRVEVGQAGMRIDRFVKDQSTQRPLTHELLHSTVHALGGEGVRIEVTKLQDQTFYANLVLTRNGTEIDVDARPSDAIALAVRNSAHIYVHEDVLDEVATA